MYTYIYINTYINTYIYTYIHIYIYTYIYIYIYIILGTDMSTIFTHKRTHTHTHKHTHTLSHTHTVLTVTGVVFVLLIFYFFTHGDSGGGFEGYTPSDLYHHPPHSNPEPCLSLSGPVAPIYIHT
jgi:uncharacterized membrane protein